MCKSDSWPRGEGEGNGVIRPEWHFLADAPLSWEEIAQGFPSIELSGGGLKDPPLLGQRQKHARLKDKVTEFSFSN